MLQSFYSQKLLYLEAHLAISSTVQISSLACILCLSLLFKQMTETRQNYPYILGKNSFIFTCYSNNNSYLTFANHIYCFSFNFRTAIIFAFLLGFFPKCCILLLLVSYISEFLIYNKNHVLLTILLLALIFFDTNFIKYANIFTFFSDLSRPLKTLYAPSILFIKTLLLTMYLATGVRKYRRQFYNGRVISDGAKFSLRESNHSFHLSEFTKKISLYFLIPHAVTLARLTIVLQLIIPFLLCLGGYYTITGVLLGILMHLGICLLLPRLLVPFSAIMMAVLLLWL